jgi:glycosyltransferase involved in cell wall biosynthesis
MERRRPGPFGPGDSIRGFNDIHFRTVHSRSSLAAQPAPGADAVSGIKRRAVALARRVQCAGFGALHACGLYRRPAPPAVFVSERADWAIRWVGRYYVQEIEARHPGTVMLTDRPQGLYGRLLHFGSQFMWQVWADLLPRSNRYVTTYFHGKPEDGPEMARHVDYFLANHHRLARVVTAAGMIRRRLLAWGLPPEKVVHVNIGIESGHFRPPAPEERVAARRRFGVPDGTLCVGSFQKDGVGWSEGLEPKLIKGPDLLVAAAERLAREFPLFVLLTGPARGYVKRELERRGVPFAHVYFDDYRDLAAAYRALDLYLMTSREEGGPFSLLESMASGVPLVTTRVGMAEDFVEDGVNGALVEVEDLEGIVERGAAYLADPSRAAAAAAAGRRTAERYDWSIVAEDLYSRVYRDLLP